MSNFRKNLLVRIVGVAGVVLTFAGHSVIAQQARYRGASSTLPPWAMDMQITPFKGTDAVTTQIYNGRYTYDGFGGTWDPASGTLNPGNFLNWTAGGLAGQSAITGGLVGGPLGSPASRFNIAVGPMPVAVAPPYGVGYAAQSFVLLPLLPAAGGVMPPPGNGTPPPPPAPGLFTGIGSYGYTRVQVNLVFQPNGNWVGQVLVMRVQPSPGNPAGVRLPDTLLNVTGVLNPNGGPIVKLALTPTVPLPPAQNYPNIAPQSPECDVSFLSGQGILCNVLQIPAVGISSFFVKAQH